MTAQQKELTQTLVRTAYSPGSVFTIAGWELKRMSVNVWSWVAALAAFLFFLGMVWFKHAWSIPIAERKIGVMAGTSAVGLLFEFVNVLLLVLALMLPFVVTDAIARDYKQRIHEVLMATPVSTWAYVWGRFLAILCVSLGLSILLLIADLSMSQLLAHLHADIPAPDFGNTLIVWAVVIVPATVFLTGVGFTLGTLWPRRSTTMMLAMLVGWVLLYTVGDVVFRFVIQLYAYVDPTSTGVLASIYDQFTQTLLAALAAAPIDQQATIVARVQQIVPDLSAWVLPHYGLAVLSVILVGVVAVTFRRFRDVLN